MPKDTKTLGNNKTQACESLGFAHKKRGYVCFDTPSFSLLDYQDSNLGKQNQNLLCYHYTIVQTYMLSVKKRCKDKWNKRNLQIFQKVFFIPISFTLLC